MMTLSGPVLDWVRGVTLGLALISPLVLGACAGNTAKASKQKGAATAQDSTTHPDLMRYAQSGDVGAQYDLGLTLALSNPKAAAGWLEQAALQGYGAAAYELGKIQTEPKRAIEWYSMASAMGHVGAQHELGDAYFNGLGTAREPGWGLMWFERAARAGYADAQYAMGMVMANDKVGPVQPDKALVWLLIAQANEHGAAQSQIDQLKADLSPEAIAFAQQRAHTWTNEPVSDAAGDRATLRFTQYALGRLGYAPGPADGIAGAMTENAIAAFRAKENLGGGGLDGRVLDRMRERLAALRR